MGWKMKDKIELPKYLFLDKTLFFPEEGILAIGDLHIGYEQMLIESGIQIPRTQVKEIIEDLKKIITEIKKRGFKLTKIVFLGDIKHFFHYKNEERNSFLEVYNFLKNYVNDEDIILIKGNHDKFDFSGKKMKNLYLKKNIVFTHGDKEIQKIYDKGIKYVVIGHLHPSVMLKDKKGIKKEKFKCFLTGNYKNKQFIVLPSFFNIVDGIDVNDYVEEYEDHFSIISRKSLLNFKVHVIGDKEIFDFGKVKNL